MNFLLNPLVIKLLVVAALVIGSFVAGVTVESNHRDAQLLTVERAYIANYKAQAARYVLAGELAKKKTIIINRTITVIKEVPSVTTVYVPTPGAAPVALPPTVFTTGFNRLWNSALGGDAPASAGGASDPTGGTDLAPSGLTRAEILTNHTQNSLKWGVCRAQLNALIDYEEGRKDAR